MLTNQNGSLGKQPPTVTIDQTTPYNCKSCGSKVFDVRFMLRKASKIQTGMDTDMVVPIQVYTCADCGQVAEDFLPNIPGLYGGTKQSDTTSNE